MSDTNFFGVLRMPYDLAMGDELSRHQFYSRVQEAVTRLELAEAAPVAIPEGWQLAPKEPTEEMHVAAVRTAMRCTGNDDFPPRVYRAMLASAPQPPAAHTGLDPEMGWLMDAATAGELAAYDQASAEAMQAVTKILDGKDDGKGSNNEPWATVRRRLLALVTAAPAEGARMRNALFELGWRMAARWAKREDLYADTDSTAYMRDRDAVLDEFDKLTITATGSAE